MKKYITLTLLLIVIHTISAQTAARRILGNLPKTALTLDTFKAASNVLGSREFTNYGIEPMVLVDTLFGTAVGFGVGSCYATLRYRQRKAEHKLLTFAVLLNKEDEIKEIISNGADINELYDGKRLLELAVSANAVSSIRCLISLGAKPTALDYTYAIEHNFHEAAELLQKL
ncbi:hypothetical protein FJ365_01500 [Candidatus Dependentiae bacterium]|nr:hypothetical protein [Candidatus Dependentiae bacterium]